MNQVSLMEKLPTGIPGFDAIMSGGLPKGRTTLVAGTAGSAKTVFATQFLVEGVRNEEPGVFVTFEESPDDIRENVRNFGWTIADWESEGKWSFVDGSPQPDTEIIEAGAFDLGALLARIEHAVQKIGAKRVSMDSLAAVFSQFSDGATIRRELFRIARALKQMGVTSIMTAERAEEYGEIARFRVEEFVADNVIILRNVLEEEARRRTVEVLKFRGTHHRNGEFPFIIKDHRGIVGLPLSEMELKQRSSSYRIHSGVEELDRICGGGFFRDSIVLVSGATGTGKTLLSTHFLRGGLRDRERCLLLAFEESRDQLFRNASGWGMDFEAPESQGLLKVSCQYPESAGLDEHLLRIRDEIEEFRPHRVALDSLSSLERTAGFKAFREFVIGVTSYIKEKEIAGLLTSTSPSLIGGASVTEAHISTITDSIIMLRYVEVLGEVRRGLTVLKMRGSMHEKGIFQLSIDGSGMHIGPSFRNVSGILSGNPVQFTMDETERLEEMFRDQDRFGPSSEAKEGV